MKTRIIDHQIEFILDAPFSDHSLNDFFDFYHISKKMRHQLRMDKKIYLNHQVIQHNPMLNKNDCLVLDCLVEENMDYLPQEMNLTILYEDEFILVVDKPKNCIIHPEDKNGMNTLVNGVSFYYQQTHQKHTLRYIHRLDKDTTGCILFSKQPFFQAYLDHELSQKNIRREYLAIVEGTINQKITIDQPIGKDRHHANKYRVSKTGLKAVTHITPLLTKQQTTLIQCVLETGRTHQIRVHCAYIKHPLISDELYGKKNTLINRCALHSASITFTHPLTLEKMTIEAPYPQDFLPLYKSSALG